MVTAVCDETGLDMASRTCVPDVGQVLAAVFAGFRARLGEEGGSDVADLLVGAEDCRSVLRSLCQVPSLARRSDQGRDEAAGGAAAGGSAGPSAAGARLRGEKEGAGAKLRVGTWNIAGGQWSSQAPVRYGAQDQRQVVVAEIVGWRKKFGCDVVALQECEGPGPMEGLLDDYVFVGSAPAKATRGHVHLYVRKGLEYERVCEGSGGAPFVAARVKVCSEGGSRGPGEVCVVAVHLPSGERAAERARVLGDALRSVVAKGVERTGILVVGDCNVREDEVSELCDAEGMRDASYAGKTWGVSWNRFDKAAQYRGPGLRFDRAFFGKKLWAQGHLVARGPVSFEGAQFCKSDHFGLMVYVDAADAFAGKGKACVEAARVRRAAVAGACEGAAEREAQEVRAERQAAQEEKALEREKAGEKDRASFVRAQQMGGSRESAAQDGAPRSGLRTGISVRGECCDRATGRGRGREGGFRSGHPGHRGLARRRVGRIRGAAQGRHAQLGERVLH